MKFTRITVDPDQMGGVPCIRGLRIPVAAVVGIVAEGQTDNDILKAYPDLELEDIREALKYAAEAVHERELNKNNLLQQNHPELFTLLNNVFPFYLREIKRINVLVGGNNIEAARKILLTQFCLAILEHLNGIYTLLSSGSFLSPIPLFRAIIEFEINWFYIIQDAGERLEQFAGQGLIKHEKMIKKAFSLGLLSEQEKDNALLAIDKIDTKNELRVSGEVWEKVNIRRRAELLGKRYLRVYDMGYAYFSGYTHPSAFNSQYFVSYGPNDSIRYHFFNKDHSKMIMLNVLDITNRMMKVLDSEFELGKKETYVKIDRDLDRLFSN